MYQSEEERLTQQAEEVELMLLTAISSAQSLGFSVRRGVATWGKGDCIFEAVIDQFRRSCFKDLMAEQREAQHWRDRVALMVEESTIAYSRYYRKASGRLGTKKEQWTEDWAYLRQRGNFDCPAGDLLLPGLAACLGKNILVFNTDHRAKDPFTLHLASTLGGGATTEIPLVLCYSGTHYEGLQPNSEDDDKKIVEFIKTLLPEGKTLACKDDSFKILPPPEKRPKGKGYFFNFQL